MSNNKVIHYQFNAEISKLMKMIIHNFYSSKDVFLRELISNASDAIDKAKYYLVNNHKDDTETSGFLSGQIKISPNKEANTITIEDNGIGMTENDLVNCLGIIAKSGTEEFIQQLMKNKDKKDTDNIDLIGQFGIGFYSAFLVADRVQVITKHISTNTSSDILIWESNSSDGYSITSDINQDENFIHGTKIVLYLNTEVTEYLDENKITEINFDVRP